MSSNRENGNNVKSASRRSGELRHSSSERKHDTHVEETEKEKKARRKKEIADEKAELARKTEAVHKYANNAGIPRTTFRIIKPNTVAEIIRAGLKKYEEAQRKAQRKAERNTKKNTNTKVKLTNFARIKAAIKEVAGSAFNSIKYRNPRKGQSEANLIRLWTDRRKAKDTANNIGKLRNQVIARGYTEANFKYKKGDTLAQLLVEAEKRKTARLKKNERNALRKRLEEQAAKKGLTLKIRGKLSASKEAKLFNNAEKRKKAKTQKNARDQRIRDLEYLLWLRGIDSKYLKFVGTKSDEVLIQEAIKRAKAGEIKNTHGTRKQHILAALAPLQLSKEQIKKVVCVKSF